MYELPAAVSGLIALSAVAAPATRQDSAEARCACAGTGAGYGETPGSPHL